MLESMSGVAAGGCRIGGIELEILVRSVNHRYLDISVRCPPAFQFLIPEWEAVIQSRFRRGRIELEVKSGSQQQLAGVRIQEHVLRDYIRVIGQQHLSGTRAGAYKKPIHTQAEPLSIEAFVQLLSLPGVVQITPGLPDKFPVDRLQREVQKILTRLKQARVGEGRKIAELFRKYLKDLDAGTRFVRSREKAYRGEKADRMSEELRRVLMETGKAQNSHSHEVGNSDGFSSQQQNIQTVLNWLEKNNIQEELERIPMHTGAIRALLSGPQKKRAATKTRTDAADSGRLIEFYAQELLRECNTIGSKARDFEIRNCVVRMKTTIENIKEQVRNIC
ncbi:MAG: DUF1732 domain-containing protein [Leptospiraceae bacterium]|nr:DUF1732 domain-containing protein [Leptospiraceae bacterium]